MSDGEDIELDARLLGAALDRAPAHVVGHSSGAIVGLLVAAAVPGQVRSLTLMEPPACRFVDLPSAIGLSLDRVRAAAVPTLIVTGGHADAFERLNDDIAEFWSEIEAAQPQ